MIHNLTDNNYEMIIDYSVKDSLKSFKEEVLDELYRVHLQQGEMPLLYSGGMDSTLILRSLQELGVKVKTLSFSFTADNSDIECELVKNRCKKYGIENPEFFYFEKNKFFDHINKLRIEENIVYPALHGFLMDYCVRNSQYDQFYCGMHCEYKLSEGKILMPPMPAFFKKLYPNKTFGFTTDRTFLSYFKHPQFIMNYKKDIPKLPFAGEDVWYVRDLIYMDCYPDIERSLKNFSAQHNSYRDYITGPFLRNHYTYVPIGYKAPQPCVFDPEFLINV